MNYEHKCREYLMNGDYTGFVNLLNEWIAKEGKNKNNLPFIAIKYYIEGDYNSCANLLKITSTTKPEYKIYAVFSYMFLGEYDSANTILEPIMSSIEDKTLQKKLNALRAVLDVLTGNVKQSNVKNIIYFYEMINEYEEDAIIKETVKLLLEDIKRQLNLSY